MSSNVTQKSAHTKTSTLPSKQGVYYGACKPGSGGGMFRESEGYGDNDKRASQAGRGTGHLPEQNARAAGAIAGSHACKEELRL